MTDSYVTFFVVTILLVASFTFMGLLALWAATSPIHWLLRCAAVLAVLSPLLLIPAYELWSLFAFQACTVAAGVTIRRWRATRRQEGSESEDVVRPKRRFTFRFSILTLLALTCLVAMLTPIIVPLVKNTSDTAEVWTAIAVSGVCAGCAVLFGAWLGTARRKWPARLAAALLCLGVASVAAWFDLWLTTVLFDFSQSLAVLACSVVFSVPAVTTWLLLRVWFAGAGTPVGTFDRVRRITARSMFCLLLAALALPPAYVTWELAHPLPVPDLPVPQPNGIDDIVAAGTSIGTSPILSASVEPKSTEELAAEVAKHAADYERLRLGLTRDVLALTWAKDGKINTKAIMFSGAPATTGQAVRQAARGLMREAQLAQQQKRYGDAARIALDNVHLGRAVTRNALLVDYLIGAAVEDMGNQSLYQVLPQLSADECREMVAALAGMERQRESIKDVLRRDRACTENMWGWPYHLYDLLNRPGSVGHRQRMLGLHDRGQAKTRLLITELALLAYQLENGSLPDELRQLEPEFLAELPADPFDPDGQPLRYVRTDDTHVLYSIGYDGRDDGGRLPAYNPSSGYEFQGDGDLRLDVFFSRDDNQAGKGDAAHENKEQ